MRTPVASIEGYLGLALNPATAHIDEKARDFITKAHESARHLGRLFQDLLDISKAEDGRLKNEPEIVNVNEFVKEIFDGLTMKANEKQLNYVFMPDVVNESGEKSLQPIFYANIDPNHFREVVGNLIENAIKYTSAGEVLVNVSGDDKQVSVSVKDSGIGIPAEDLPHLFQKFYRVDNSDTREIGGTGLGLYLSRRLAEAMSGNLRVESEYKHGSTFYLEIPRVSNTEAKHRLNSTDDQPAPQTEVNPITTETPKPAPKENVESEPEIKTPPAPAPTSTTISIPVQVVDSSEPITQPPEPKSQKSTAEPTLAEIEENLKKKRQRESTSKRRQT